MPFMVMRWNGDRQAYVALKPRFATYAAAETYGAQCHVHAEEAAEAESSRCGRYIRNTYRFLPISEAQFAKIVGAGGRRVIG